MNTAPFVRDQQSNPRPCQAFNLVGIAPSTDNTALIVTYLQVPTALRHTNPRQAIKQGLHQTLPNKVQESPFGARIPASRNPAKHFGVGKKVMTSTASSFVGYAGNTASSRWDFANNSAYAVINANHQP